MVFAFVTLVGGYFAHQYFWLSGPGSAALWNDSILPFTLALGWILLLSALALAFTGTEEESQ
jgi:hypothetical protein